MPGGLTKPNRRDKSALADAVVRGSGRQGDRQRRRRARGLSPRRPTTIPARGPGQTPPEARIEDAVMRLARLLGRQIAREHFQPSEAANDNPPTGEAGER